MSPVRHEEDNIPPFVQQRQAESGEHVPCSSLDHEDNPHFRPTTLPRALKHRGDANPAARFCSLRAGSARGAVRCGAVHLQVRVRPAYFHSLDSDMFLSASFFITFATAISKSSCVTWMRRSRRANMPASVHTACRGGTRGGGGRQRPSGRPSPTATTHLALGTRGVVELGRDLLEVDAAHQVHLAGVDLQDG